ncbi:hypothetical protein EOL96_08375 [Candidatus Saccharibacteria bacterium]|nr:hypothetical protein [Candidatus Saccharibacteria bacterium]
MWTHALATTLSQFADVSAAVTAMNDYVAPTIKVLASLASIACVFFIVNAGYLYMTSSGKPDKLEQAKYVLKRALLGLVIVLAAFTLTSILTNAYGTPHSTGTTTLPNLNAITPAPASSGLVEVLISAVTGFLNNIIQSIAAPFLAALSFFTQSTPLMAENPSVFNLWLAIVGITNVLLVIVLALIGLHVMSAASFGFDEIEFKHLLPRIGLIFLLMNTSIFLIDGIIELSNALITAVGKIAGASTVWDTLTTVVKDAGGQGLAALLLMLAFLILAVVLLVYYVGRLVTLYIGAVLSPLVVLVWLIPGFRDFSETAMKTYLTTIFNLFIHVVILQLAASLFVGIAKVNGSDLPDTVMAMVVGLATLMALLKTQGVMMQFSYASMGARNMRKLGGQFINGTSYLFGKGAGAVRSGTNTVQDAASRVRNHASTAKSRSRVAATTTIARSTPTASSRGVKVRRIPADAPKRKTGTTYEAPQATPLKESAPKTSTKGKRS